MLGIVVLSVIGPFGTDEDLDFGQRLVFWSVALLGVGFFMHVTISVIVAHQTFAALPKLVRILLGAIAGGLPGAAVVVFVDAVFRPPMMAADRIWDLWIKVSAIGLVFGVIEFRDWRAPARSSPQEAPMIRTRLHDRLPDGIGDDIVSLSMNDHYVEITTTGGSHMELMRMSDAVSELDCLDGLQVHRSHWAVLRHIEKLDRQGSRHVVVLSDGRSLPVSATYLEAVRAALPEVSSDP